jgi:hypothetical protein
MPLGAQSISSPEFRAYTRKLTRAVYQKYFLMKSQRSKIYHENSYTYVAIYKGYCDYKNLALLASFVASLHAIENIGNRPAYKMSRW